ncbi:MAG TPA: phosphoglucomutase/phosphomannomutase family protein [Terriglobales bacterium]|nr:phosphoglucomutase/phosphomannomutase family protein [Terriglobales bacterium]
MPDPIKFGTDGWRAVIADDFTFENVRRVAAAIANYVLKNEDWKRGVLVAYDTRFGSRRFAELVSETLASAGLWARLANDYTPTPALSYSVKHLGAAGGVMVTSSHNPYTWNGIKYKASYGGSGAPAIMKQIEGELDNPLAKQSGGRVEEIDFKPDYVAAITKFADLDLIARTNFNFLIDCMYGAGRNVLSSIFSDRKIRHVQMRAEVNPLFPGINPEPIEPHVRAAQEAVVREKCHAGFITDGDADRIGAVTETGQFVDAHKCYAVLLQWLLEYKKWPGAVTRAFNTTSMLDRIAARYGRELIEHGIGFKYVCDVVLSGKEVLIGGEESGGIGIPRHLPERDGILNSLLLANAMAESGKTLGQLVDYLQNTYGPHYYGRKDMHINDDVKQSAITRATANSTDRVGPYRVTRKGDLDGIKLFLDAPTGGRNGVRGADAWVLLRASGTEPLLRVYAEAASPEVVREILSAAEAFVLEPKQAALEHA